MSIQLPTTSSKKAFTLVELLVVIGVIAVLISILLPAMTKARQAAMSVRCASNLRQIGQMLSMYSVSNPGFLPPVNSSSAYNPNAVNRHLFGIWHMLGPYVGSPGWASLRWGGTEWLVGNPLGPDNEKPVFRMKKVFICPRFEQIHGLANINAFDNGYAESTHVQTPGGFYSGGTGYPSYTNQPWARPRRISSITKPTERIALAESTMKDWHISSRGSLHVIPSQSVIDYWRHNNGSNVLFVDGHVTWFSKGSWFADLTNDLRIK